MTSNSVIILLAIFCLVQSKEQAPTCQLCKTLISTVRSQVSGRVTEPSVSRFVKSTCDTFLMTAWCEQNLYPYIDEIFRSLRDNRTDAIACNRVNLCKTKITKVTGDIMFAERDRLSRIVPIGDSQIQRYELFYIQHPSLPGTAAISGFGCSPDYCAVLLKGTVNGKERYATSALSITRQIPQLLADVNGPWFGPWYDANTDEFWMAYGTSTNFTFGIFDPEDGIFYKRISTRLYIPQASPILSGSVLNRMLYFTVREDYHVWVLDLSLKVFVGNITLPQASKNIMLTHNPVTQIMYGYTPGPDGVFRFDSPTTRTKIASIDFTGVSLVPSSTIDPTENTMWISLWGIPSRVWMKIDLNKNTDNYKWVPVGSVEGFFDFNPYTIERTDE